MGAGGQSGGLFPKKQHMSGTGLGVWKYGSLWNTAAVQCYHSGFTGFNIKKTGCKIDKTQAMFPLTRNTWATFGKFRKYKMQKNTESIKQKTPQLTTPVASRVCDSLRVWSQLSLSITDISFVACDPFVVFMWTLVLISCSTPLLRATAIHT